jgi:hypothetical protein
VRFCETAPDYAEFTIGPAEGRTRWLHPGCGAIPFSVALPPTCEDALATTPSAQDKKIF